MLSEDSTSQTQCIFTGSESKDVDQQLAVAPLTDKVAHVNVEVIQPVRLVLNV